MPETSHQTVSDRGRRAVFIRRVALAPLCLCLVAGLHAYRVFAAGQTPWKGGGFGMFSTVDAESARYLRCYLVGGDGRETPLLVPPELANRAAELRAAPAEAAAAELAERLARRRWTQLTADELALAGRLAMIPVGKPVTGATLRPTRADDLPLPRGLLVAAEALPAAAADRAALDCRGVRVEVWRYHFDERSSQLAAERMLSAEHDRVPASEVQP